MERIAGGVPALCGSAAMSYITAIYGGFVGRTFMQGMLVPLTTVVS